MTTSSPAFRAAPALSREAVRSTFTSLSCRGMATTGVVDDDNPRIDLLSADRGQAAREVRDIPVPTGTITVKSLTAPVRTIRRGADRLGARTVEVEPVP